MTATPFPDGYVEHSGVYAPKDREISWGYSDGDEVEQRIHAIVSSTEDISCLSMQLREKMTDWQTLYHLTPLRANLLRPVEHLFKGRVLEVGAGCGAITRYLGETGAQVFAVEGSPRRASVARARTRDLANVTVITDNAQNVQFAEKFDVVTLIGVLEYARQFGNGLEATEDLLRDLKGRLKPGGTLLIAIENQLGLKYFAGAKEDHKQRPFFGIEDLYSDNGVVTFGKVDLQGRLKSAGFADCQWYYPFPDYKLPTTVLAQSAFEAGVDMSGLFAGSNFDDPQGPSPGTFSLDQAWKVISRNGLTGDLANSFLIACRVAKPKAVTAKAGQPVAWHYSVDRHPGFAKQAVFETSSKGGLSVRRTKLADAQPPSVPLRLVLKDEPFLPGRLWSSELSQIMNKPGWTAEQVGDWLRFWIDAVLKDAGVAKGTWLQDLEAPGRYLDALPFNLLCDDDGATRFIDLEWEQDRPVSLRYLAYRALSKTLWRITSCAQPARRRHLMVPLLLQDALRHAGLHVDLAALRGFEDDDRRLASMVKFGVLSWKRPSQLGLYRRTLKVRSIPRDSLVTRAVRRGRRMLLSRKRPA